MRLCKAETFGQVSGVMRLGVVLFAMMTAAACATTTGTAELITAGRAVEIEIERATFERAEMQHEAEAFFGPSAQGLDQALAEAFEANGAPSGYILGQEMSGAVGLTYGVGTLVMKGAPREVVYWQGSALQDEGSDADAKVMMLVHELPSAQLVFSSDGAAEGTFYVVGEAKSGQRVSLASGGR